MPTISKNLSKKHSSIKKSKRVYRKHKINKTKKIKKNIMKMKGGDKYTFPSALAQATLNASSNPEVPMHKNPGIFMSETRQSISVNQDLTRLFGERNPEGQTLLYCLLRFTMNPIIRNKFLYSATLVQLIEQNTNCGSIALMGYFWGEIENPRMQDDTPVADVFENLPGRLGVALPLLLGVAKLRNYLKENALGFAMQIAEWRPADGEKLKSLLK